MVCLVSLLCWTLERVMPQDGLIKSHSLWLLSGCTRARSGQSATLLMATHSCCGLSRAGSAAPGCGWTWLIA